MLKKQQQQNQQQLHHHQGPSSNQQQQMIKDPQSVNRQQASFNQVDYHLQKQQNQQHQHIQPDVNNISQVPNNLNNGSANFSSPYSVPNVLSSIARTPSAVMTGKNHFQENGGNVTNVSVATMNDSQPSNTTSQEPSSAIGKRIAPNWLDPNTVSGNTMGIEPINIGVTPTDIKLLSDMSSSGIVQIFFNSIRFLNDHIGNTSNKCIENTLISKTFIKIFQT